MVEHDATECAVAVVLAPPGSEQVAVRALSAERLWRVIAASDPMLALAEIALAERAAKTRLAWDGEQKPEVSGQRSEVGSRRSDGEYLSVSFILAHPRKWAIRHELIEAIARYFPEARLFAFDERGLREAKTRREANSKTIHRGGRRKRGEKQVGKRSSAAPPTPSTPSTPSTPPAPPTVNSISREEIEMLLGGENR